MTDHQQYVPVVVDRTLDYNRKLSGTINRRTEQIVSTYERHCVNAYFFDINPYIDVWHNIYLSPFGKSYSANLCLSLHWRIVLGAYYCIEGVYGGVVECRM